MNLLSIVMKLSPGLDTNAKGHCVDGFQGGNMSRDIMFSCCFETFWGISWKVSLRCRGRIACLCASQCRNCVLQEHMCTSRAHCMHNKQKTTRIHRAFPPCRALFSPNLSSVRIVFPWVFLLYVFIFTVPHSFPLRCRFSLTAYSMSYPYSWVQESSDFISTSAHTAVSVL